MRDGDDGHIKQGNDGDANDINKGDDNTFLKSNDGDDNDLIGIVMVMTRGHEK